MKKKNGNFNLKDLEVEFRYRPDLISEKSKGIPRDVFRFMVIGSLSATDSYQIRNLLRTRLLPKHGNFNLKDGKKHGKLTHWYENGELQFEANYKDGKMDGKWTWGYDNGQIKWEVNYKDGKYDGKYTSWYENGHKEIESNWKDGNSIGKRTKWYENGQRKTEGNYKDGKRDGKWTDWYENGQKKSEGNYNKYGYPKMKYWHKDGYEIDKMGMKLID